MSARTNGTGCKPWQSALGAFFRSEIQCFQVGKSTDRVTRAWWNNRHKYLTQVELSSCVAPGRSGESAGHVGIGSEYIDSAAGDWNDCLGDSRRSDEEQSKAGEPALADASVGDANAVDAAHHNKAQAQVQAQSPSGESPSSGADRAADAASAETAAVDAASNHASPAAAATAEGELVPAAATKGGRSCGVRLCLEQG
jgi:hypothetical protein